MGYRNSRAVRLLGAQRTESVLPDTQINQLQLLRPVQRMRTRLKFLTSLPGRRGGPLRIDMDRLGRRLFNMRVPGWQSAGALLWLGKGGPTKAVAVWCSAVYRTQLVICTDIEFGQRLDDFLGFQAHGDHALEQLQWVLGVAHGFHGPVVGVVDDAAGFVGTHRLAFHHPGQCGLAVDYIIPGCFGDAFECDAVVVDDCGLVALLGELHLLYAVIGIGQRALGLNGQWVWLDCFVVQMKLGQGAALLAESPEVGAFLHCRNARQLLAQVVGKALAVVRGM